MFPQLFESFTQGPVIKRAILKGSLELEIVDIKDFAPGSFRHIDDSPFGGGAGMVMRCGPVLDALKYVKEKARSAEGENPKETLSAESAVPKESNDAESAGLKMRSVTAAMSPAGARFDQKRAHRYADLDHLILICGHYEGMDERIYRHTDEEISIGDYILTGGEIAAMAVTDAVTRLLPGAIRSESTSEESFENGLLEYSQYTPGSDRRESADRGRGRDPAGPEDRPEIERVCASQNNSDNRIIHKNSVRKLYPDAFFIIMGYRKGGMTNASDSAGNRMEHSAAGRSFDPDHGEQRCVWLHL